MSDSQISFQDFYEHSSIASVLVSIDGVITLSNPAARNLLGLEPKDSRHQLKDCFHSDSRQSVQEAFGRLTKNKLNQTKVDCRLINERVEPRWVRLELTLLDNKFAVQLIDISRERAHEERISRIDRGSLTGMWEVNHLTQASWTSNLFDEITANRWTRQAGESEEGERHWFERIHPEDVQNAIQAWHDHLEKDVPYSVVCRYQSEPGKYIWIEIKGSSDRDENGKALFTSGSLRDVTSERTYKTQLEQMNTELESFAYLASHDLQAPLRHVMMYVEMLKLELEPSSLNSEAKKAIETIQQSTHRMKKLIDDLLSYSRAGELKASMQSVNTGEVVSDVLEVLEPQIQEMRAQVNIQPLPQVVGDRDRLNLLFTNLIGNALKYSKRDQPCEIEVSSEESKEEYTFTVCDNGIGVPKDQFKEVFEIFKRLHNNDEIEGTGLGLAICCKVVELHGGRIWIEKSSDAGTEFCFTIRKMHNLENKL